MDLKNTSGNEQQTTVRKKSISKLSAIVFTDIKGFSQRMGESETLTLKLLRDHNRIIRFVTRKHRGRIVKGIGDGFFFDFDSAVEAVQFAIEAQERFSRYNANRPDGDQVLVRIGVSLGEVRVINGDMFGNDVNIAARLQTLAEPGGVCISREVYERVKSKLHIVAVNLGPQELKNICKRVEVFKILLSEPGNAAIELPANGKPLAIQNEQTNQGELPGKDAYPPSRSSQRAPAASTGQSMLFSKFTGRNRPKERRSLSLLAFAVLLPALLLLPQALQKIDVSLINPRAITQTNQAGLMGFRNHQLRFIDKSLAVTFFENRTALSTDNWLRAGLADMIITDLESKKQIDVLGRPELEAALDRINDRRNGAAGYELAHATAKQMQADLMLFGWIVRVDGMLRIDAQIFDVASSELLLAERVSGTNVLQMVDELTRNLNQNLPLLFAK